MAPLPAVILFWHLVFSFVLESTVFLRVMVFDPPTLPPIGATQNVQKFLVAQDTADAPPLPAGNKVLLPQGGDATKWSSPPAGNEISLPQGGDATKWSSPPARNKISLPRGGDATKWSSPPAGNKISLPQQQQQQ